MSIDPEILELIHAEIDGVASERDRVRLREAIARDPEVAEAHRRLRGLGELLSRVGREEPPERIAPAVMRAVREHRSRAGDTFAARMRRNWPEGRVALRYAYAVAAGIVIGVMGLQLLTGGRLLGPPVSERGAVATLPPSVPMDRLDLAPAGVPGFVTLRSSASGTEIGVDLSERTPVELALRYDPVQGGDRVEVLVVRQGETTRAGFLRIQGKD